MYGPPSFIPRDMLRVWLSIWSIGSYVTIGKPNCGTWLSSNSLSPATYIKHAAEKGKPVRSKRGMYRIVDVFSHAKANGLTLLPKGRLVIEPSEELKIIKRDIQLLNVERSSLLNEVDVLNKSITKLTRDRDRLERIVDGISCHSMSLHKMSVLLTGKNLLSAKEIIKHRQKLSESAIVGVYFLIKSRTIVYVGQSIDIRRRIVDHTKDKDFDSFSFLECRKEELSIYESLYIHVFKPTLNGHAPVSLDRLVSLATKGQLI
jgi:hypothetical protein